MFVNTVNETKKLISSAVLIVSITIVYGQDFYDSLSTESNRIYDTSYRTMDVDSLNTVFFDSGNVRMLIDTNASYQVLFSDLKGFSYSGVDPCPCTYDDFLSEERIRYFLDSTLTRPISSKRYYDSSRVYRGDEFIKKTFVRLKDSVFHTFPLIRRNDDPYNAQWTVFSNEEYLVFRFVSLYFGERYSYRENLIYFKRIE